MLPAAKRLDQQLFSWLWRRPWFRREFYNLLGRYFRHKTQWQMMNCGLIDAAAPAEWPPEYERERHCYTLYAQLVAGTSLTGCDVLELGAGRGGGARFLHATQAPRRFVALDYAPATVRWCRKHFTRPGLEFVRGDAADPSFPEASFDVITAVEVTHCLPDKPRFLSRAARLLRPGGRLLIADFFYRRSSSMHALERFESAVQGSDFNVIASDDWTPGVIAAIQADSVRRATEIQASVPRPMRKIALGFTSTTASSTYTSLVSDRAVYRRYVLERRG